MDITFGLGVKKVRALICGSGRVGVELGDTLFALDVVEVEVGMGQGTGNVLRVKYDVCTSMLCDIMQFTCVCVSTIADQWLSASLIISNVTWCSCLPFIL